MATRDRNTLLPGTELVIWTIPPGYRVLAEVIQHVRPERIYWFANDPNLDASKPFLKRLAGLAKHTLQQRDGRVTLEKMAAAMAHNQDTVQLGLLWLQANGSLRIELQEEDTVTIRTGTGEPYADLSTITNELQGLLHETAGFRKYLATTSSEGLGRLLPDPGNLKTDK
jgi:hypothetical protein